MIMHEQMLFISKASYLTTIVFYFFIIYKCWRLKSSSRWMGYIFWIEVIIQCLYMPLALAYVLDIQYTSWVGYTGWMLVNYLFMLTDLLLAYNQYFMVGLVLWIIDKHKLPDDTIDQYKKMSAHEV